MGGHGSSDDEPDWVSPEGSLPHTPETLNVPNRPSWQWQRHHVRVTYQGREWLLNEKLVSEVLMVLKATDAIPQRVIGFRNNQRVQRTDRLHNGDVLLLIDLPRPNGQITVVCEGCWNEQVFGFKVTGEVLRVEELVRATIWTQQHIEDALYWIRLKTRPYLTDLTDLCDGDIVQVKARRSDQ
jgi:hypothetical protein